jgi:hypothetical protein
MPDTVKVFVSYSHQDAAYLKDDSLLGFLKGLEKEGVEFWTDRQIRPGELWDEVIKANIQDAQIALVLVSQGFLDSDYCQKVEIERFLANKAHLFPIILSACEWKRHEWLRRRQFVPGGEQTIEEHYTEPGKRKRLFLDIREALRVQVEQVRRVRKELAAASVSPPSPGAPVEPATAASYSGKTKLEFCKRLGDDWRLLADYLEIPPYDQARFEKGDEARGIWVWLENRRRLDLLPEALRDIDREDLAELLHKGN